jgi:acetate kinase
MTILTLNAGSSSLKFALFADPERAIARGQVEGLSAAARLICRDLGVNQPLTAASHAEALSGVLQLLARERPDAKIAAVGHRIVHGGPDFAAPVRLDEHALIQLSRLIPMAPLHQPHNLAAVAAARAAFPDAVQIGCFDTAFHRRKPRVEDLFALPRAFYDEGVRRYGFHGLSYEFLADALAKRFPAEAAGRVIIAHLGNGASMCALSAGRSIGSTMGFSALDGLPMGSRCGAIDPGVLLWLMREKGFSADDIENLLYTKSGLKGLSGVSQDMRDITAAGTPDAEEAIAYFVARCRREIGALAALLGGLDAIVFAGGIGENAHQVRARICDGLDFLGLVLDPARNASHATRLSADASRVTALMIPTDEEVIIARHTAELM